MSALVASCDDDRPNDDTPTATTVVQTSPSNGIATATTSPSQLPPTIVDSATPILVKPTLVPLAAGMQRYDGPCLTIDFPADGWYASTEGIGGQYDAVILQTWEPGSLPGRGGITIGMAKLDIVADSRIADSDSSVDPSVAVLEGSTILFDNPVTFYVVADNSGYSAYVRDDSRAFGAGIYAGLAEDVVRAGQLLEGVAICDAQ